MLLYLRLYCCLNLCIAYTLLKPRKEWDGSWVNFESGQVWRSVLQETLILVTRHFGITPSFKNGTATIRVYEQVRLLALGRLSWVYGDWRTRYVDIWDRCLLYNSKYFLSVIKTIGSCYIYGLVRFRADPYCCTV